MREQTGRERFGGGCDMIPMFRSMVIDGYGWFLIWGRDSGIVSFVTKCWPGFVAIGGRYLCTSRFWQAKAAARPPSCLCSSPCIIQQLLHIINLGRKMLSNLRLPNKSPVKTKRALLSNGARQCSPRMAVSHHTRR